MNFTSAKLILRRNKWLYSTLLSGLVLALTACGGGGGSGGANGNSGATLNAVAAENFYGDIVRQLGGSHVQVSSIISDPNTDPHEYESSTKDAKAIATARLVVLNGIGYDAFMNKLLSASPSKERVVINAGDVTGKKEGDNPHIWYSVPAITQVADSVTGALQQLDPANREDFATRNQRFKASLQPLNDRIAAMKAKYAGMRLTQTEPVFAYMGEALGLKLDEGEFQHAIESGTDPSPQAVAAINQAIMNHEVKALLYNSQTASPTTTKLKDLAKKSGVPVVGVSETAPAGQGYQLWMLSQLDALEKALSG